MYLISAIALRSNNCIADINNEKCIISENILKHFYNKGYIIDEYRSLIFEIHFEKVDDKVYKAGGWFFRLEDIDAKTFWLIFDKKTIFFKRKESKDRITRIIKNRKIYYSAEIFGYEIIHYNYFDIEADKIHMRFNFLLQFIDCLRDCKFLRDNYETDFNLLHNPKDFKVIYLKKPFFEFKNTICPNPFAIKNNCFSVPHSPALSIPIVFSEYDKVNAELFLNKIKYSQRGLAKNNPYFDKINFKLVKEPECLESLKNTFCIVIIPPRNMQNDPMINKVLSLAKILKQQKNKFIFADWNKLDSKEKFANILFQVFHLSGGVLWRVNNLSTIQENTCFIGLDLGHKHAERKTNIAMVVFNKFGEELNRHIEEDVELNEKIRLDLLTNKLFEIVEQTKKRFKTLTLHRDGIFLESVDYVSKYFEDKGIKTNFVEIIKSETPFLYPKNENTLEGVGILYKGKSVYLQSCPIISSNNTIANMLKINYVKGNTPFKDIYSQIYYLSSVYGIDSIYHRRKLPITTYYADRLAATGIESLKFFGK